MADIVQSLCSERRRHLSLRADRFGNLLIELKSRLRVMRRFNRLKPLLI
ncbi:MAG: hypothetical protein ABR964_02190 [Tepidisphaeraceae bacterium]|jgi:hypothetical protein